MGTTTVQSENKSFKLIKFIQEEVKSIVEDTERSDVDKLSAYFVGDMLIWQIKAKYLRDTSMSIIDRVKKNKKEMKKLQKSNKSKK
jgi:hypothetical protein